MEVKFRCQLRHDEWIGEVDDAGILVAVYWHDAGSPIFLSPPDARKLAKQLKRAAKRAEEEEDA